VGGRDPFRIVLDGRLRVRPDARVFTGPTKGRSIVATGRDAPGRRVRALEAAGVEVLRLPARGHEVSLPALARTLASRDLVRVLVEGGAQVHAAFLKAGLADRLLLYVAPLAIGGSGAPAWLGGAGVRRLRNAWRLRLDGPPRRLDEDLLLELIPG
jgi:diaminohydroxyphosphoribosylaminopyrimidine deaminase/5-amino-6-(5-phosphoribosylamino)uracil reductase